MKVTMGDDLGYIFHREEGGPPFALTFFYNNKEYLIQVKVAEEIPEEMSEEALINKVAAKEEEWTK